MIKPLFILIFCGLSVPLQAQSSKPATTIENDLYRVDVDSANGVIYKVFDKTAGIDLISEPRLADNFRLLIPLPDLEANYIDGKDQRLSSLDRESDSMLLRWAAPLTNARGPFDVNVTMKIAFVNQHVEFRLNVENHTQYSINEVWYPILGGITGIGDRADTEEMIPTHGWSTETRLFHDFPSMSGLGIPVPEAFWSYPFPMPMSWMDIYNKKKNRSVYYAIHDEINRYKILRFELHPGLGNRRGGNWPRADEAGKLPVGLQTHWTLFPYLKPGQSLEGPPCVIQFHAGDWHRGAELYRDWFKSKFPIADPKRNWMYQQSAFQDTMFLLPEGNVMWTFKDIPRWAQDARDYGVRSVLISGWNVGGHDGGYPNYTPDPRLGTKEELAAGIKACHEMGMKVFFFVNVQPVDTDTKWYRDELHKYQLVGPLGTIIYSGWGMGSLGARLGFTARPLAAASSGIPEFRKIIVDQMVELARMGADGIHIDKLCPAGMNYNPALKMSPDRAVAEGQWSAVSEIQAACLPINKDFSISAEGVWDRLLEFTGVSWAWHQSGREHTPAFKYTFQQYLPAMAAAQPFDYTAVNNAIRYGYQIFVGPGNYTKSMAYEPFQPLSRYIKEAIRIRHLLKDTIYSGEFMDNMGAQVSGDPDIGYCVFRNPATDKRACVIVNYAQTSRTASLRGFNGKTSKGVQIHQPFVDLTAVLLPVNINIPAERFVVMIEN